MWEKLIGHIAFDVGALCIPFGIGWLYMAHTLYQNWRDTPGQRLLAYIDGALLLVLGGLLLWLSL